MDESERSDNETQLLLQKIRNELNSIVNAGAANSSPPLKSEDEKTTAAEAEISGLSDHPKSKNKFKRVNFNRVAPELDKPKENQALLEKVKRSSFLDVQSSQSVDEDLQKMQMELQKSYELFQTIGDKFETINFGGLRNRIKDLHMNVKHDINKENAVADLKQLFDESYMSNRLGQLTTEMGERLRKHPGEFGDIPEVSAFFQACTQLQHGLQRLKQQRTEATDLGKRVCLATEASYDRIEELRKEQRQLASESQVQKP